MVDSKNIWRYTIICSCVRYIITYVCAIKCVGVRVKKEITKTNNKLYG